MKTPAVIQLDRVYAYPPSVVWTALTDPELHAQWWAAGDVRPVVGHTFHLDMGRWGKQPCEVLATEPERLLQYSFARMSTITWRLAPEGEGTRLTLIHEGFDLDTPMGRQAYEGMKQGWPDVLERLASALAARAASDAGGAA